jgi:hypothetical protein
MGVFKLLAKFIAIPIIVIVALIFIAYLLKAKYINKPAVDKSIVAPPMTDQWTLPPGPLPAALPPAATIKTQRALFQQECYPDLEQGRKSWTPGQQDIICYEKVSRPSPFVMSFLEALSPVNQLCNGVLQLTVGFPVSVT